MSKRKYEYQNNLLVVPTTSFFDSPMPKIKKQENLDKVSEEPTCITPLVTQTTPMLVEHLPEANAELPSEEKNKTSSTKAKSWASHFIASILPKIPMKINLLGQNKKSHVKVSSLNIAANSPIAINYTLNNNAKQEKTDDNFSKNSAVIDNSTDNKVPANFARKKDAQTNISPSGAGPLNQCFHETDANSAAKFNIQTQTIQYSSKVKETQFSSDETKFTHNDICPPQCKTMCEVSLSDMTPSTNLNSYKSLGDNKMKTDTKYLLTSKDSKLIHKVRSNIENKPKNKIDDLSLPKASKYIEDKRKEKKLISYRRTPVRAPSPHSRKYNRDLKIRSPSHYRDKYKSEKHSQMSSFRSTQRPYNSISSSSHRNKIDKTRKTSPSRDKRYLDKNKTENHKYKDPKNEYPYKSIISSPTPKMPVSAKPEPDLGINHLKQSTIKSIVISPKKEIEYFHNDQLEDTDLRSKLSRKNLNLDNKIHKQPDYDQKKQDLEKCSRENLLITIHQDEEKNASKPVPVNAKIDANNKIKYKKIQFVINLICDSNTGTTRKTENNPKTESSSSESDDDLSFLEDFNVDEIVESLGEGIKSLKQSLNKSIADKNNNGNVSTVTSPNSYACDVKIGYKDEDAGNILRSPKNEAGPESNSCQYFEPNDKKALPQNVQNQSEKQNDGREHINPTESIDTLTTKYVLNDAPNKTINNKVVKSEINDTNLNTTCQKPKIEHRIIHLVSEHMSISQDKTLSTHSIDLTVSDIENTSVIKNTTLVIPNILTSAPQQIDLSKNCIEEVKSDVKSPLDKQELKPNNDLQTKEVNLSTDNIIVIDEDNDMSIEKIVKSHQEFKDDQIQPGMNSIESNNIIVIDDDSMDVSTDCQVELKDMINHVDTSHMNQVNQLQKNNTNKKVTEITKTNNVTCKNRRNSLTNITTIKPQNNKISKINKSKPNQQPKYRVNERYTTTLNDFSMDYDNSIFYVHKNAPRNKITKKTVNTNTSVNSHVSQQNTKHISSSSKKDSIFSVHETVPKTKVTNSTVTEKGKINDCSKLNQQVKEQKNYIKNSSMDNKDYLVLSYKNELETTTAMKEIGDTKESVTSYQQLKQDNYCQNNVPKIDINMTLSENKDIVVSCQNLKIQNQENSSKLIAETNVSLAYSDKKQSDTKNTKTNNTENKNTNEFGKSNQQQQLEKPGNKSQINVPELKIINTTLAEQDMIVFANVQTQENIGKLMTTKMNNDENKQTKVSTRLNENLQNNTTTIFKKENVDTIVSENNDSYAQRQKADSKITETKRTEIIDLLCSKSSQPQLQKQENNIHKTVPQIKATRTTMVGNSNAKESEIPGLPIQKLENYSKLASGTNDSVEILETEMTESTMVENGDVSDKPDTQQQKYSSKNTTEKKDSVVQKKSAIKVTEKIKSKMEETIKICSTVESKPTCQVGNCHKTQKTGIVANTKETTSKNNDKNTGVQSSPKLNTKPQNEKQIIVKSEQGTNKRPDTIQLSVNDLAIARKLQQRMLEFLGTEYTITSLIKSGKYSKIFKCHDGNGNDYAVKSLKNIYKRFTLGVHKEVMLMRLQNDIPKKNLNMVYLINGFSSAGHWCFLMEYFPFNLEQAMVECEKSFYIDLIQHLAIQLVSAVTVLRNNGIVHSDIKPSHILMNSTNTQLKLCGFDASYYQCLSNQEMLPNIGTVNYRAPEVILGHSASYAIDVWSVGTVLYEMATFIKLFPGYDSNDILFKQMCTLGPVPCDMIRQSAFRNSHFRNECFMRKTQSLMTGQSYKLIYNFHRQDRLKRTIFGASFSNWSCNFNKKQKFNTRQKLFSFLQLLEKMLVMHPKYRLPIEFVSAHPFIHNVFLNRDFFPSKSE